jgi:4-hydroxy-2-oxoheptanedioate aldolase
MNAVEAQGAPPRRRGRPDTGALFSLEAIGRTPELDGIFVGPVDLSSSLGFPGDPEHPQVVEAVRDVLVRIRASGVAAGVYAPTSEAAARWLDAGAGLVALSADSAMLVRSLTDWATRAKSGVAAAQPDRGTAGGG